MTTDWSTRLRPSPFQDKKAQQPLKPEAPLPVDMVIGIDFGTRFTKIALTDGRQRQVWGDDSGKQLIPSVVHVGPDGTVLTYPTLAQPGSHKIEYLKMLLAESNDRLFRSIRGSVLDRPIDDAMCPLAAAFLNSLIRNVRASLIRRRPDLSRCGA
jgi:hypothetical protein